MEKKRHYKYKFIDLFAGIGGTRIAFEASGAECVFSSEWDKFCQLTYEKNFGERPSGDIRDIDASQIPNFDILTAGFSCQPFSIAGVSKERSLGRKHGFEDEKQGNLFFEIARIIKEKNPKAFLLENVKNLKSHDKGKTFEIISKILNDLGYDLNIKVIDARGYVPQHRERIFIVGFRKDLYPQNVFNFPDKLNNESRFRDILDDTVDHKYTLSDKLWAYLQEYKAKHQKKGNGFGFGLLDPDKDNITRTLSARYHKDGSEILIKQKGGSNPRRLTPRECARLMGYRDNFKITVSDTQAYRQFGNSLVVPLVTEIAENMIDFMDEYYMQKELSTVTIPHITINQKVFVSDKPSDGKPVYNS
ncbi:DNA (cytosine-5-)-methyltransferase [candidate division WWE3 bacterium CG_4_9_14_3_um_filter_34_6]|uniref:DNA (cytosine-5-)-methyltransferase n=1 Tax=candidate division WWE3 bacterium CG_4_9_14_3_um_filter_34_6 TaxID=1975079 RepID=A0A2M7X471_UNCKA|nr:MAG: DNA (cytosine-5-)-methyltransferase [candidate division WWE3 bacterium CG_4_9_14_3_um_filter_34_6]